MFLLFFRKSSKFSCCIWQWHPDDAAETRTLQLWKSGDERWEPWHPNNFLLWWFVGGCSLGIRVVPMLIWVTFLVMIAAAGAGLLRFGQDVSASNQVLSLLSLHLRTCQVNLKIQPCLVLSCFAVVFFWAVSQWGRNLPSWFTITDILILRISFEWFFVGQDQFPGDLAIFCWYPFSKHIKQQWTFKMGFSSRCAITKVHRCVTHIFAFLCPFCSCFADGFILPPRYADVSWISFVSLPILLIKMFMAISRRYVASCRVNGLMATHRVAVGFAEAILKFVILGLIHVTCQGMTGQLPPGWGDGWWPGPVVIEG